MEGSKIIQRSLYQIMEIYPKARMIKASYHDGKFEANIYCPDAKDHVNVRSEIVDCKLYVSLSEVKKCEKL